MKTQLTFDNGELMNASSFQDTDTHTLSQSLISADTLNTARLYFVDTFDVPITHIFVNTRTWTAMIGDKDIFNLIDPYSDRESVLNGNLGVMFGTEIVSNCFDHPAEQEKYDFDFQIYNDKQEKAINFKLTETA